MNLELTRDMLFWCTIGNYGILLAWFLAFLLGRRQIDRLHRRWFRLSENTFDALHYAGMAAYKLGILLFNLVPWVVLAAMT